MRTLSNGLEVHGDNVALTVAQIERLKNSRNGNPTWRFRFEGGAAISTATDTAMAYEVGQSWVGQTFHVKLDNRGRIINMTALKLR